MRRLIRNFSLSCLNAILISGIILFTVAPKACSKEPLVLKLPATWKFKLDPKKEGVVAGWQNPSDEVDADWKSIPIGKYWESLGYDYNGEAWYRCSFTIGEEFDGKDFVLTLPKIDESDHTFFNGIEIGSIKKNHAAVRMYTIPHGVLRINAKNYIAVKVIDNYKGGGMYSGNAEIREVKFDPLKQEGKLGAKLNDFWQVCFDPKVYTVENGKAILTNTKSVWRWIIAPNSWETCGVDYDGTAWMRKKFLLPETLKNKKVFLGFGNIDDRGEVYINGSFVGKLEKRKEKCVVEIKDGILKQNEMNELLVRVEDTGGFGGVMALMNLYSPGEVDATIDPKNWQKSKCDLNVMARFSWEGDVNGEKLNWQKEGFDDSGWGYMRIGDTWESQGASNPEGIGWYRLKVNIPEDWKNTPLNITLKNPSVEAGIYINGKYRGSLFWPRMRRPSITIGEYFILDPSWIRYGETNTIAIRVVNAEREGGLAGSNTIAPQVPYIQCNNGDGVWTLPFNMKMGDKPGREFAFRIVFPVQALPKVPSEMNVSFTDFYNRKLIDQNLPLQKEQDTCSLHFALDKETSRNLYFAERLEYSISQPKQKMKWLGKVRGFDYSERDEKALPALAQKTEDTPLGKLTLIDEIDMSVSPLEDEHPYKEGTLFHWGAEKKYSRERSTNAIGEVKEILGRKARLPLNMDYFAYRIGRGKLKPFTPYLLVIDYPEDVSRYFSVDVQTGKAYLPYGWKTGISADDPMWNTPVSGKWQKMDGIVLLGEKGYGHNGLTSTSTENGFWVWFQNKGDKYYAQYGGNLAVGKMKLYEIDPALRYPKVIPPQKTPERILMSDAEFPMKEDADFYVKHAKAMGLNAIGPIIMQWGHKRHWYNDKERKEFASKGKISKYDEFIRSCKKNNLWLIPRIEYGGSADLPDEAKIIAPNGKIDPVGRYVSFGPNILHPLVLEDFKRIIDELVKERIEEFPIIRGLLWRTRSMCLAPSYGNFDIDLYYSEIGSPKPSADYDELRRSLSTGVEHAKYVAWWQQKRAQFIAQITAYLRSIRSDLVLLYNPLDDDKYQLGKGWYNWGNLGKINNKETCKRMYEEFANSYKIKTGKDFLQTMLTETKWNPPGELILMDLLKDIDGFFPFGIATHRYLTDNPEYLNYFQTKNGAAIANMPPYDEVGRKALHQTYECDFSMPGRDVFSVKPEVEALFHADPVILSHTVYAYGRTFAASHREFAKAFRALPWSKGKDIPVVEKDVASDLKIRWYDGDKRLAILYKGLVNLETDIILPENLRGVVFRDLVNSNDLKVDGAGKIHLKLHPMEIRCYQMQ